MYSIYAGGRYIYSDVFALDNMKVISPKLTLEDNGAGSLSMTLPPQNIAYSTIVRMVTDISVQKDGTEIWAGRVLSESEDFYRNRVLYCEGELAFFNDSTQPPAEYPGLTVRGYLERLISVHNSKAAANRQFAVGAVTVVDESFPTYYTNHENTMSLINALVEQYGGHIRVRKVNGVRYVDYLKEYPDTCSQVIQFGSNLIEFTRQWDSSEFATVLVPLGSRLEKSPIEALDAYLTVESVNQGSMYVQSGEAVGTYGRIEKTVTWNDVSDPAVLLEKAKAYLSDLQFDNMELELSALDLHYLDVDVEAVKLLDEIRVISRPHGLDRLFPVAKLEIPLDAPERTRFKLGDTVKTALTSVNNQVSADIMQKIESLPKAHSILKEAKENAAQIMHMATTGYITITKDEHGSDTLYISNVRDYTKADKLWQWNMNGLGYSRDGGRSYEVAITMDGAIMANFITAGTLSGDRVRTGVIRAANNNVVFDLTAGKLTMKKGSVKLGEYAEGHYDFEVDDGGSLYARKGTFAGDLLAAGGSFGGTLIAADGDFKGVVKASDFLDSEGNSMLNGGKFKSGYLELYGLTVCKKENGQPTQKVTFQVADDGSVTIDGKVTMGKGSTIDWSQVADNGAKNDAAAAKSAADTAKSAADTAQSTADAAKQAAKEAKDAIPILPSYIKNTYIDATTIKSPKIEGNDIVARSAFRLESVYEGYGDSTQLHGYMGRAQGAKIVDDWWGSYSVTTYGVAMCAGTTSVSGGCIRFDSDGSYVIATDSGVRMTYKKGSVRHNITVTENGCFADGKLIGGSAAAVWG